MIATSLLHFAVPLFVALNVQLTVLQNPRDHVRIEAMEEDSFVRECLYSGLEVRIRFQSRLCDRRWGWDACGPERTETRKIQFDPISTSYTLEQDLHSDAAPPEQLTVSSGDEAFNRARVVQHLALGDLPESEHYLSATTGRIYLSTRAILSCRSQNESWFEEIPRYLTFGAVTLNERDSGWTTFDIAEVARQQRRAQ